MERVQASQQKQKQHLFQVGHYVYLHVPYVRPGESKKFHRPWKGLYEVGRKWLEVNYKIKLDAQKTVLVHINQLKPYHGRIGEKRKVSRPSMTTTVPSGAPLEDEEDEEEYTCPRSNDEEENDRDDFKEEVEGRPD